MRRRRIRIQRHEDERPEKLRPRPAIPQSAAIQQASIQAAEPAAPLGLRQAQANLLEIQQTAGNQAAMRVMRTLVQRAPGKGADQKEETDALRKLVNTGDEVSGVNDRNDAHSLLAAAVAAYKEEKYGTALIAFRELHDMSPTAGTLINMAICELRLDMFPEAAVDLEESLENPDLTPTERKRALGALDAVRRLESAGAVGFVPLPNNVNTDSSPLAKEPRAIRNQLKVIYRSAEGAAKSEDYEAALSAFQLAQKRLPHPITLLNIGKCYMMLQKYSEATTAFQQALRDRSLTGGARKATEAELETIRGFQGKSFDDLGDLPPDL